MDQLTIITFAQNASSARRYEVLIWRAIMNYNVWISLLSVLIMAGGLGGVLYIVIKKQATINNKMIQFLAVGLVLPLLVALGSMNTLGRETIGTLLGVVIGYVLSGFGKE